MRILVPILTVTTLALTAVSVGTTPGHAAAGAQRCHGKAITIKGTSGPDTLRGTPGDDVIAGLGRNDTIVGRGGNDTLCGGGGADRLTGGPGDDRLFGGRDFVKYTSTGHSFAHHGDHLVAGPGDDVLDAGYDERIEAKPYTREPDTISWSSSPRGVRVNLTEGWARGDGHDRVVLEHGRAYLTPHADRFVGTALQDVVSAGAGDDVINTLAGDDTVRADARQADDDRVRLGAGDDRSWSYSGDDRISGGPGDDEIEDSANRGSDRIYGGSGNDVIDDEFSGARDQLVDAGSGEDDYVLLGRARGATRATWDMTTGVVVLRPSGRKASVLGAERATVNLADEQEVWGTDGPDELFGSIDYFHGLGGDDRFKSGDGDETFDGGEGTDTWTYAGAGRHTCISVEVDEAGACGEL